jgi:hypothetical protein
MHLRLPTSWRPPWVSSQNLVTIMLLLSATAVAGVVLTYPRGTDLSAYLEAAERLVDGQPLYSMPVGADYAPYVYSPWLAILITPLTDVPREVVLDVWQMLMAFCLAVSLWPVLRIGTPTAFTAALVLAAFGFHGVWIGQVEPMMVALLVVGIPRRWGPLAIGIAASLKVTPIILVVVYLGRRQWRSAAIAIGCAAILWAPAILFGLDSYGVGVGHTMSLLGFVPVAWAVLAFAAVGVAYRLAHTRYAWLAAVVAWLAILPRFLLYDVVSLAIAIRMRA